MLRKAIRAILPGSCLACGQALPPELDLDICAWCRPALPWNDGCCPQCAQPIPANDLCRDCRANPPPFCRALAPLRYQGYPRLWVNRLKDHLGMAEGRALGLLLAEAAAGAYGARPPDALIPIPLTPLRLARRGHNQALTLALPVARRLGIPVLRHAVARRRGARRQRTLARAERLENLRGVFTCRRSWSSPGPVLAIVDDVVTTGATAAALTRSLLDAGAAEVHVLAATRMPRIGAGRCW